MNNATIMTLWAVFTLSIAAPLATLIAVCFLQVGKWLYRFEDRRQA